MRLLYGHPNSSIKHPNLRNNNANEVLVKATNVYFPKFLFFNLFQRTTKTADTMAMKPPTIFFLLLSAVQVFGQSNYASHGNNINYIGNGLPEETVLDGKVSDIDFSARIARG